MRLLVWQLSIFILCTQVVQAQTLVLNDTDGAPYTTPERDGFLDLVAGKAFNMAGVELKLVRTPAERGLRNANEGIDDGELNRIKDLDKIYTNLIRIPEKIMDMEFVAFSKNRNIKIDGWQSLREYNIGHIRGWKIFETHTAGFPYVQSVRNADILFSMLEKERIDVALFARWPGLAIIKDKKLEGIYVLEPVLTTREMFIYLHKKHSLLIPKISDGLKAIKNSGEYARLFEEKVVNAVK